MSFNFKGTMAPSHLHTARPDLSNPGTFRSIRALLVQTAILGALWVPEFANAAEPEAYSESLASRFLAALRSKDISRRLAILHSRSRACISPETQPHFDWIFSRQLRLVVSAEYKVLVTSIGPTPRQFRRTASPISRFVPRTGFKLTSPRTPTTVRRSSCLRRKKDRNGVKCCPAH